MATGSSSDRARGGALRFLGARRWWGPVLVLCIMAVWILAGWRELYPPVPIGGVRSGQVRDMVFVAGGTLRTETPIRSYEISAFFLDRFEVTREEYSQFLGAEPDRNPPRYWGRDPTGRVTDPELPVTWVTWHDAQAYARWVGKRLPKSEEWEWAARGPLDLKFPWGSSAQQWMANTADLQMHRPTPAGLFEDGRSTLGLYDMVGNVAEWTSTRAGADIPDQLLIRGGSFNDFIFGTDRMDHLATLQQEEVGGVFTGRWVPHLQFLRGPSSSSGDLGFRCALDVDPTHIWTHIERLGYRDPVGILLEVKPATRALEAIGEPALPLLSQAVAALEEGSVKQRLRDLIRRIRSAER